MSPSSPGTAARELVVLGSTGSIGTQALDVVRRHPDRFRVAGLAAGGGRVDLLAAQALEFRPDVVAVARASAAQDLQLAFYAEAKRRGYASGDYPIPKIVAGPDAVAEVAAWQCDVVLNGVTGALGLASTLAALDAGRTLALANKESARPGQIVPVDSEHSALAQCLRGGRAEEVRRLVLTASGGPFRGRAREELTAVTPEQALNHPTWDMGPVVTINSQSVIHSMVEFTDGSTLAQASPPDMRLPIALGIDWPDRVPDAAPGIDWTKAHTWELFPLDDEAFPAVALARRAGERGVTFPAVYNAANEECVDAFRAGRLPFLGIVDTVARVLDEHDEHGPHPSGRPTLDDVLAADGWARARARELTATA